MPIDLDAIYAALADWDRDDQPTNEQIAAIIGAHEASRPASVIIVGNPADGFACVGPVRPDDPDVTDYVETHVNDDWWYLPLIPLAEAPGQQPYRRQPQR